MHWKIIVLGTLLCSSLFGDTLDDKTTAYFVDHYGPAVSSKIVSSASFYKPKAGDIDVKGVFSIRRFRREDLWVTAVFFHPSLKLASVKLQLNRTWTAEQLTAAMKAYGGQWQQAGRGIINTWSAPDGTVAINMLTWVEFISKEAVDLADKTYAESEAKKKAIPRF